MLLFFGYKKKNKIKNYLPLAFFYIIFIEVSFYIHFIFFQNCKKFGRGKLKKGKENANDCVFKTQDSRLKTRFLALTGVLISLPVLLSACQSENSSSAPPDLQTMPDDTLEAVSIEDTSGNRPLETTHDIAVADVNIPKNPLKQLSPELIDTMSKMYVVSDSAAAEFEASLEKLRGNEEKHTRELLSMLNQSSGNPGARFAIIHMLGQIGDSTAVEPLEMIAKTPIHAFKPESFSDNNEANDQHIDIIFGAVFALSRMANRNSSALAALKRLLASVDKGIVPSVAIELFEKNKYDNTDRAVMIHRGYNAELKRGPMQTINPEQEEEFKGMNIVEPPSLDN